LTYDAKINLASKVDALNKGDMIENKDLQVVVSGFDEDKSMVELQITDKLSDKTETLKFSLGWWASWINYEAWFNGDDYQNSGDYIFRPMDGQYEAFPYSNYKSGQITKGKVGSMITLYFSRYHKKNDTDVMKAMVNIQIDPDFASLKFDVKLDELPAPGLDGYEQVVKFSVENFENNQTFYTDSNGLEM